MGTEAFTIRSDSKKVKQLDMLASQMDRSRSHLLNQAIDQLLELHTWQIDRTIEGIEAADEGHFASDAENERILNKCANS
ncbi:MAG: CopG family transcriptional regulator [Gammaproteobacteria bacterium]|nr:CopG family transcriptional regulator [Gammaproteobacteria bacterium]